MRKLVPLFVFALAVLGVGCTKKPTAAAVCAQIEASGVGANCHPGEAGGLGAAAAERVEFQLPSLKKPDGTFEGGSVYRFNSANDFTRTVQAFDAMAVLAGRHRYGSEKALIFVQMNSGLSADGGQKVKAIVDGL